MAIPNTPRLVYFDESHIVAVRNLAQGRLDELIIANDNPSIMRISEGIIERLRGYVPRFSTDFYSRVSSKYSTASPYASSICASSHSAGSNKDSSLRRAYVVSKWERVQRWARVATRYMASLQSEVDA